MKDFYMFFEQLKSLYEDEMYEDVKLLADLLIGLIESKRNLCDSKDEYMLYYYYGNSAFYLKDYKLAENLFNKALQMNKSNLRPKPRTISSPDCETDITIKYNLYLCLMNDKKYQEAYSILDSIPSKQRTAKILLALGKLCQLLMYTKEAISIYKEVFKSTKLSLIALDALINLGVKLDELPKLPVSMNVEWLNLYLKGKVHQSLREYRDAIDRFTRLDAQFVQKSSDVLASLATCQYLNGEYTKSCITFEKLHRLEPAYTSKMDIYAYLLYQDKTDRDKINALEKLACDMYATTLNVPETWTVIGYYCLKKKTLSMKTITESIKTFVENALALDSQNSQALLLKAILYSKSKSSNETAIAYREVTRMNPYFFEAYKGLVENLLNLEHKKDAIQIAGNAIKMIGSNARTFTLYGDALSREVSTQEKSKTYLYKAIKLDPDNQEAVICLVKVCMTLQHFDEALEVLGKFIRHNSSNQRLLQIYIELMKRFKRTDEAILYLNKIAGMDPTNAKVRELLEKAESNMETNQDDTIPNI